uniref:Acyltransferase 3 domain-containing protein n=1 Tax=Anopheles epiroticus TaxID=199890 RepID=A0A182P598_9DIPT
MSNYFRRVWCMVSIAFAVVGVVSGEMISLHLESSKWLLIYCDVTLVLVSEYWRMPRVFKYDDYDVCLNDNPTIPSVYCVVKAVVRPDNGSEVWGMIERISANWKVKLNHAHLDRGICVRDCETRLRQMSGRLNDSELLVPKFNVSYRYTFNPGTFRDIDLYRHNYSQLLEKCVNMELSEEFGLKAQTEIEYCDSNTVSYPIDWLEITFLVVMLAIAGIVLASSVYDFRCKTTHGLDHYKQDLPSTKQMYLVSFSIIRNWYRITSRGDDPLSHDLRYIHTIRMIVFMGVTFGHVSFYAQPRTALTIEDRYSDLATMIVINGTQIVTTFFAISAMMLVLFFVQKVEETKKKVGAAEILIISVARYVRLTPVYAFVMLLEATWVVRMGDGPLWQKGFETGRSYCRKNWWANLLYINNYYKVDEPCMLHTWYLAADFHLFVYGLLVCALITRYPKIRNALLGTLMVLSYFGTAAVIYLKEYDAIPIFAAEQIRYFFWYWNVYQDAYVPTHMYLVNYTFAIACAFYYMHLAKTRTNYNALIKVCWFASFLLIPVLFAIGYFFYHYQFATPSLWMSLLFPFIRLFYSAILFTGGVGLSFRFVKLLTRLADIPFFTIIGRLTYSAYLCHLCLIKMSLFNTRSFFRYGLIDIGAIWAAAMMLSYLVAWILCLVLESPFVLIVLVCGVLGCIVPVHCAEQFNMTQYRLMPRVFHFDDYDECLRDDPSVPDVYCMVKAVVQPNASSVVWNVIADFSSNWKQHVNHAHLDRGLCLSRCTQLLDELGRANVTEQELKSLIVPKFQIDFPYIIKNGTFRDVDTYRRNYSELFAMCINYELQQKHGLRAYTEIEYCDSNRESYPIDNLEIAFLIVLAILLLVVVSSSWYDHRCKQEHGLEHYQKELPSKAAMVFVSFSIIRNWYRLTSRGDDSLSRSIRYVHAVRFMIFMMINVGHNILYAQPRTAMTIERKYGEVDSMIVANGSHVVTTFFVISALMLVLSLVTKLEQTGRKIGFLEIIMISIARYVRLTPVYAFIMFLEATWLVRYLDGPLWRKGFETGRTYCRKHWWVNLLYINNYYATDEPCMQHTWYLAADFHMFVYGLAVCAVVLRLPKYRTYILSFLLLVCSMIAAIVVYVNEFEAVTVLPPEPLRFFFWYWDMYHGTYLPTHMYLVNYTAAIMGSFYMLHLQSKNFKTPKMFSLLWLLGMAAIPGTFVVGYFIYSNLFETPAVWMAVVFPLGRIFYTALMFLLSVGFIFRASKPILRLLNIHFFGILGRLTYCAYLCHFFITRATSFGTRRLANLGVFEMNASSWSTLVMSYVFGWLLCLMLESPFIALQKLLFESLPGNQRSKKAESNQHLQESVPTPATFLGANGKMTANGAESYANSTEQQQHL